MSEERKTVWVVQPVEDAADSVWDTEIEAKARVYDIENTNCRNRLITVYKYIIGVPRYNDDGEYNEGYEDGK